MAGIDVFFSIEDEFSKSLEKFNRMCESCAGSVDRLSGSIGSAEESTKSLGDSAEKAAAGLGSAGLGGAFLFLNQALQFFQTISEKVLNNLDDIGDKQRSFIVFGKEAGAEFNDFAKSVAYSMGRAEGEVRKAGQRFGRLGVGGNEIKELTKLADRFANLNPNKNFSDVADALADAVMSRNSSGLADLLGGGDYVEQRLERKHIDRYLKKGDVSGAMDLFKEVADEIGYTQEKADEFGMTFDRKIQRITERVKNYFTDLFSDIVSIFEPVVDKLWAWLEDEDVQNFFEDLKTELVMATAAAAAFVDTVVEGWSLIIDAFIDALGPVYEGIKGIADDCFPYLSDKSLGIVETLTGILVGGISQIVYGIAEVVQHGTNIIVTGIETDINFILDLCESLANGAIGIANDIRDGIIDIVSDLVNFINDLINDLANTDLGEMLGITPIADSIHQITQDLERAKSDKFGEISIKRVNLDDYKVDAIDSIKLTAEAIDGAMDKVHNFFNKSIDAQNKNNKKTGKTLEGIGSHVGQLVDMGQREQDLRWLKEMAEQRFVNEINLRQLTPTINLQVKGTSGQTANDYAKELARELQRMADAGTFNAYGDVG
jgi:hypothetical protein